MKYSSEFWNARQVQRVLARAIACCVLLVLPSCGIPILRHAAPGPELPANYPPGFPGATGPENSSQVGVDAFFNDPMLSRLIDQAMVGNQELRILNQEVEIARNEVLSRRGAYLPFLGFRSAAGLEKPSRFTPLGAAERELEYLPGKHFPDPMGDFLLKLNFFWQLDIWRELRNARDAAQQRFVAANERRNYFVTRMVADVAENYYGLMARDKRLENLTLTIELQERSLKVAEANKAAGRSTELPVQRFLAEVRKNQSEKLIIYQEIVEVENRINFLLGRIPQRVDRPSVDFLNLNLHALSVGVPAQLLLNRPDIRQAERELAAAGLDVLVARAHFFPRLDLTGGIGYEAFNPKYLFWTPDALIGNVAGELTAPLINKRAIRAEYLSANARQLESVYNYQRVILNAVTEVINRVAMVQNYTKSIEIKKQQLESLVAAVETASQLFQAARIEYIDVLFSQRDLRDARMVIIETKQQQLSAIVNAYQALGGGLLRGLGADACIPPTPGAEAVLPEGAAELPLPKTLNP